MNTVFAYFIALLLLEVDAMSAYLAVHEFNQGNWFGFIFSLYLFILPLVAFRLYWKAKQEVSLQMMSH